MSPVSMQDAFLLILTWFRFRSSTKYFISPFGCRYIPPRMNSLFWNLKLINIDSKSHFEQWHDLYIHVLFKMFTFVMALLKYNLTLPYMLLLGKVYRNSLSSNRCSTVDMLRAPISVNAITSKLIWSHFKKTTNSPAGLGRLLIFKQNMFKCDGASLFKSPYEPSS